MKKRYVQYVSHTPATTSASVVSGSFTGLLPYDWFTIDARVAGNVGGTLDVYLQRKVADDAGTATTWIDWARIPQQASSGATVHYTMTAQAAQGWTAVGTSSSAPVLAANTAIGGHPGNDLRVVSVSGSGTTASTAVGIWLTAWQSRD